MKRLYRSQKDKIIAGVCGGIGEYFGIDPVIIRIITVILFFWGGSGIIAYII
ncbi:MAG: PspC domain-containing protein, partial [Candidatus Aminicenantes bacterium]|nr:PspC domain-containing protein [Candidatus Aminicenantes bacterium]